MWKLREKYRNDFTYLSEPKLEYSHCEVFTDPILHFYPKLLTYNQYIWHIHVLESKMLLSNPHFPTDFHCKMSDSIYPTDY